MERDPKDKRGPTAGKPGGKGEGKPGEGKAGEPDGGRRYERPRGGPARAISELMPEVGRTAFRKFGFVQSSVVSRWPEIVGPRYARVSLPQSIRFPPGEKADGILELLVEPRARADDPARDPRDHGAGEPLLRLPRGEPGQAPARRG